MITLKQAIESCYHNDICVIINTKTRGIFQIDVKTSKESNSVPSGLSRFFNKEAHIYAIPFNKNCCGIYVSILAEDDEVSEEIFEDGYIEVGRGEFE